MFFQSKQKQVELKIDQYCRQVTDCLELLILSLRSYCETEDRQLLYENMTKVHKSESLADDIRRDIENLLYSKSLFPESRGDILGLLETLDKVPNNAESVTRMLWTHHITVPQELAPDIIQMLTVCQRCVATLLEGVAKLFTDFTGATVAVGKVDELESEVDNLEAQLIERLFAGNRDIGEKLLLRNLIQHIAAISDRAESTGDRIRIMVAKRRV
ncbi:MAG: TIGR00153 family protein [Sedimentisphaerales bacterium]|nr:TIGR00153 family protein [Sedimentisphaerales bacterium]